MATVDFTVTSKSMHLDAALQLHAYCLKSGTTTDFLPSTLRLNTVLGCENGKFVWGKAKFADYARNIRLSDDYTHLIADLKDSTGGWSSETVDLRPHIENVDGALEVVGLHYKCREAVTFLRANNGSTPDHFYTTNVAELTNAVISGSYKLEGTACRIFKGQEPYTVPLFRLYNGQDHLYTISIDERESIIKNNGYTSEGVAGYIYSMQILDSIPFYRLFRSAGKGDHFYTTSATERDNAINLYDYRNEGITGYVLEP